MGMQPKMAAIANPGQQSPKRHADKACAKRLEKGARRRRARTRMEHDAAGCSSRMLWDLDVVVRFVGHRCLHFVQLVIGTHPSPHPS